MKRTIHTDGIFPYLLYQPDAIPAQTSLPLLVFLHGVGERGTDPNLVRTVSLPRVLDDGLQIPFIVYAPQCPETHRWEEIPERILSAIEEIKSHLPVDPERSFLTGFSMGARGLWQIAVQQPESFAAYAPVSGRIPYDSFLQDVVILKDVPLWVFHGAADQPVPVDNSDRIVAALHEAGASRLRYTRYEAADHGDASDLTYQNEELYQWFLEQI